MVLRDGKPVAFDPNDEKDAVEGELFVNTELPAEKGPVKVKSSAMACGARARPTWWWTAYS